MSSLTDELRTLWVPGMHKVTGRASKGLLGLIAAQEFQVYSPTTPVRAELHFSNWHLVAGAFAADVTGMSTAAFETAEGVVGSRRLPRSAAWLLVRAYYGGFFAAHALARMLGRSHLQLDDAAVQAIDEVAVAFGMQGAAGLGRGMFRCVVDHPRSCVILDKVPNQGSHEVFWSDFAQLLRDVATRALSIHGASLTSQRAAGRLIDLETVLRDGGRAPEKGTGLLSRAIALTTTTQTARGIRTLGVQPITIASPIGLIRGVPTPITPPSGLLAVGTYRDLWETCALLIALCREVCADMADRCPNGRSFHHYAALRLLDHIGFVGSGRDISVVPFRILYISGCRVNALRSLVDDVHVMEATNATALAL